MASLPEARDGVIASAHGGLALAVDAAAGTVGGCAGILIGSPFDVLKTRAQATPATGGSGGLGALLATARHVATAEGFFAGFFRGSFVSCLGQAPNNALIFAVYGGTLRALDPASGGGGDTIRGSKRPAARSEAAMAVSQLVRLSSSSHMSPATSRTVQSSST